MLAEHPWHQDYPPSLLLLLVPAADVSTACARFFHSNDVNAMAEQRVAERLRMAGEADDDGRDDACVCVCV